MGLADVFEAFANKQANQNPHYILIFIFILIIFLIYSKRLFSITSTYYNTVIAGILTLTMSVLILSTILTVLELSDNQHLVNFTNIFNSTASKNFFAVIALVLFIMFIYEIPIYDNSLPHAATDKILFGYNGIFSNRFFGLFMLVYTTVTVAYAIYLTTVQ